VSVYDAEGTLLERSPPIRFYLQKVSVAEKLRAAEEAAQEAKRQEQEKQTKEQWAEYEQRLKDFMAAQPPEGPTELPPTPPGGTPPFGYGGVFRDYKDQLAAYRKAHGALVGAPASPLPAPSSPYAPTFQPTYTPKAP
jgi:hypothetical protein